MRKLLFFALLTVGCGASPMPGSADEPDAGESPADLAAARPADARATADLAESTPDEPPDGAAPGGMDAGMSALPVGGTARVTAGMLNLRDGPSTMNTVVGVMACGDQVNVLGGPMNTVWWNVSYQGKKGWASGNYLVPEASFDKKVCQANATPDGGMPLPTDVKAIFDRAKLAVTYSYYWGHGSWRADGVSKGSCVGNCPNCNHSGQYGADCSGFVAKAWQIPSPSPIEKDLHPYSTYNFYNQKTHWAPVPRTQIKPADSLVYNANGAGHMVLFEKGNDPWGAMWLYEARGCSYGIVYNLRTIDKNYITIRREGL